MKYKEFLEYMEANLEGYKIFMNKAKKFQTAPQYTYSQQIIEFIVDEVKKDPLHILDNIKNKLTPGAKEF